MEKRQFLKKTASVIANILLYAFIAICILGVVITFASRKDDDGTATVFGMQMRYVLSPSMEKSEFTNTDAFEIKDIPTKSMVFIRVMPTEPTEARDWYASLKVGDVLTFKYVYVKQETITHRIISIEEKEDKSGFVIKLQGDNKNSEMGALTQTIDTSLENSPNYIIGKVVGHSVVLGFVSGILRTSLGLILAVILPCLIILIFEVCRIVSVLTMDKRVKAEKEKEEKQKELDDLRRRLAELEAQASKGAGSEADKKDG